MGKDSLIIEQLKWLYAGLAGICVAFFLTLFGSEILLRESSLLLLSTVCFATCLPIFTTFAVAHVVLIESDVPPDRYVPVLRHPRIRRITSVALLVFAIGFVLLICHFSTIAAVSSLAATALILPDFRRFLTAIKGT